MQHLSFLFVLLIAPLTTFAQSQVEVEAEIVVGDSEAARAEERQLQNQLKIDQQKEEDARKDAAIKAEDIKKRTAEIHTRIEKLQSAIEDANKNRLKALEQIKIQEHELKGLAKLQDKYEAKRVGSESELKLTVKNRDQILDDVQKSQIKLQSLKSEIEVVENKEKAAKAEVTAATKNLEQTNKHYLEKLAWKKAETNRIDRKTLELAQEQVRIEKQIRASVAQIKKLKQEVDYAQKRNDGTQEHLTRAASFQKENEIEIQRLEKAKRSMASNPNQ